MSHNIYLKCGLICQTNKQTRHIVTCLYIQQPPQFAGQMAAGVKERSLCPIL